ncbi:MAG: elongation factor G [Miltoncostaeaceae bacterium]
MPVPSLSPSTIRNIAMVGHRGCGKTSLAEAALYRAGAIPRLGSVVQGTSVCDADEDERRRRMSISLAVCHLEWGGAHLNLLDTPGEPSFQADALSALAAADAALVVVDAAAGVEMQTERMWRRAAESRLARIVAVSMIDRPRADMAAAMAAVAGLGDEVVPVQVPLGQGEDLRGVVDLVGMTARLGPGGPPVPVPDDVAGEVAGARGALVEAVVATDEALLERYLDGHEPTPGELTAALRAAMLRGELVPALAVCAVPDPVGVEGLLDALVALAPSPQDGPPREALLLDSGERLPVLPREDNPALALCVKTLADPYSGRVSVMRVLDGVLRSDSHVVCARTGERERVGRLFRLQGREHIACDALGPGDIGAVAKLKGVATGDALVAGGPLVAFPAPPLPEPAMSFRASAHDHSDDDKVVGLLRRMADEDPSLDVHHDHETGDLIVGGMSELHVEVVADRIASRFGVRVDLARPHVPYRETIRRPARAEGRHRKQSGGRGQFGDVSVRVEPLGRGTGVEFVDEVVGGAIPRQYIPAVEAGVRRALEHGGIAGYPVVDLRVIADDGKSHPVDSSEMAFSIAGGLAVREAVAAAQPVLLEPVMHVEITVDPEDVGDIMGDLSARRGHPLGVEMRGTREVVAAHVPMVEMLTYCTDLRALTGGRGEYHMHLDHYDPAPPAVAERAAAEPVTA